jgi:ABC-type antimicrobial peptide transport system permease subunit
VEQARLFSILFGCFSAMALVLSVAGLFSVVAYSVAQKTKEFGVRMALGARGGHILWVAMKNAVVSASTGICIALLIDFFLSKSLARWMESESLALSNLLEITMLLIFCCLIACVLPSRRAASINPTEALRYE